MGFPQYGQAFQLMGSNAPHSTHGLVFCFTEIGSSFLGGSSMPFDGWVDGDLLIFCFFCSGCLVEVFFDGG